MKLLSSNISNNSNLPTKFTCDGEGTSPDFSWSNFPKDTKSFAFIMEDPDAPAGTYYHWIAVNIPVSTTMIKEGSTEIPDAQMITNTSGKIDYVPPCPHSGSHPYIFKVFALSKDKIHDIDINNFYDKIKPYVLDHAQLSTKYSREQ